MTGTINENNCRTCNPKWRRYDRWLVQRYFPRSHTYHKKWKVVAPIDPCSDYVDVQYFCTFEEAIAYANCCWIRRELLFKFEEFLDEVQNSWMPKDKQHTGLDTMIRTLKWWGKFDLADMLENI
ncbi:gp105 [Mycobacterium phage Barnyard]|uniref:Uncharacterized protein n=1 Tax=Mycobacterium phage Barnyard TaxID=205880 RepID=Q855W7_9CAUD|nr:gp105 [Mycobacterium phage Barnyard]AAN02159.1 hypothetical protein PBI_BARNYARD_105 [Mycobacterium phage Barnyard]